MTFPSVQERNLVMNTTVNIRLLIVVSLTICAALCAMCDTAHGQIYEGNAGTNTVGEYKLDGTTINGSLVSGLHGPTVIKLSDGNFYVTNAAARTIAGYN